MTARQYMLKRQPWPECEKLLTGSSQVDGHLAQPVLSGPALVLEECESPAEGRDVLLADGQSLLLVLQLVLRDNEGLVVLVVGALHAGSTLPDVSAKKIERKTLESYGTKWSPNLETWETGLSKSYFRIYCYDDE